MSDDKQEIGITELSRKPDGTILAYLQLLRLPTVFTAMSNIVLGYLLTHPSLAPISELTLLLLASACLYFSGMVLNDVFDRQIDTVERPQRPIPSRRVSLKSAIGLGLMLTLVGLIAAALVGPTSFRVAISLTGCVFAYDALLKKSPLGPIAMGSCRFLNVMLGASAASQFWTISQLHVATGIGVYVIGLTWFARSEAKESAPFQLLLAAGVVNLGPAILIGFILSAGIGEPESLIERRMFALASMLVLLGLINWRLIAAIRTPSPVTVQAAIRRMLLSLIFLDAIIVWFYRGEIKFVLVILALLVPALLLKRRIPMT